MQKHQKVLLHQFLMLLGLIVGPIIKKKRGPIKIKESKKAVHNDWSNDNITSKIQIHYLNFIISFLNDCVFSFFGKKKFIFKNIDYKEKSKVTKAHLEKMKHSTILDILKNIDISNKYKHYDKNINRNINIMIKIIIKSM